MSLLRLSSLFSLALIWSVAASAVCYERFYTKEHIASQDKDANGNSLQKVKNILFEFESNYDTRVGQLRLQIQMRDEGVKKVAELRASCEYTGTSQYDNRPTSSTSECTVLPPGRGRFFMQTLAKKGSKFTDDLPGGWIDGAEGVQIHLGLIRKDFEDEDNHSKNPEPVIFIDVANGRVPVQVPEHDNDMWVYNSPIVNHYSPDPLNKKCQPLLWEAHSMSPARLWNEAILYSVRNDLARPTVTARNLYHLSALMWDIYASYEASSPAYQTRYNPPQWSSKESARAMAIHGAAQAFLKERYKLAPSEGDNYPPDDYEPGDGEPDRLLGGFYEKLIKKLDIPESRENTQHFQFGEGIATQFLANNLDDGSREELNHAAEDSYELINEGIADVSQSGLRLPTDDVDTMITGFFEFSSNFWENFPQKSEEIEYWERSLYFYTPPYLGSDISEQIKIDHWVRLNIPGSIDQGGTSVASEQSPLTLYWGRLPTFADLSGHKSATRDGVYFEEELDYPGGPGRFEEMVLKNLEVVQFSALLNPLDTTGQDFALQNPGAEMIDISPLSLGNNELGTNNGVGRRYNPRQCANSTDIETCAEYQPYLVKAADYYRSIAEFWADGPASETPPGHWNTLANSVMDEMVRIEKPFAWMPVGDEPATVLSRQEYELRLYLKL